MSCASLGRFAAFVALPMLLWAPSVHAVPSAMVYAGYLALDNGTPFDGVLHITVRVYDVPQAGEPLSTHSFPSQPVSQGMLSLMLADVEAWAELSDSMYLEFEVQALGPTASPVVLAPRQEVVSVPYAMVAGFAQNAASLDGFVPADFVQAGTPVSIGSSSASCGATNEGTLRFNSATKKLELCTGAEWATMALDGDCTCSGAAVLDGGSGVLEVESITGGSSPGPCTAWQVANVGTAPATGLTAGAFTGAGAAQFELCTPVANPCGAMLAAGATCSFGIRLLASANGTHTATAHAFADGDLAASRDVIGAASGFAPQLTLPSGTWTASPITNGTSPGACTDFLVTNTGTGGASGLAFAISGTNASNFATCTASTAQCGSTLEAGASCRYGVRLSATANGTFAATGTVTATGGYSASRALAGQASGFEESPTGFYLGWAEQAPGYYALSRSARVNGISAPITVSGPLERRICSDFACDSVIQTWTTSNTSVSNGQYVQARLLAPASGNTSQTLQVGGLSTSFQVNASTSIPYTLIFANNTGQSTFTMSTNLSLPSFCVPSSYVRTNVNGSFTESVNVTCTRQLDAITFNAANCGASGVNCWVNIGRGHNKLWYEQPITRCCWNQPSTSCDLHRCTIPEGVNIVGRVMNVAAAGY